MFELFYQSCNGHKLSQGITEFANTVKNDEIEQVGANIGEGQSNLFNIQDVDGVFISVFVSFLIWMWLLLH